MTGIAECKECNEQIDTVIRCVICSADYGECCEKKIKRCDLCEQKVCPDCRVESDFNSAVVCDYCFDKLFVTKANWESLTKSINDALNYLTEEEIDAAGHKFALGYLQGRFRTMKAQYGF